MVEFTIITQHGLNVRRWILISAILFLTEVSDGGTEVQSESCAGQQAITNRNSFNFRKFGNASNLEDCVDFCCRDDTCELAIFSRGFHCFGVSCNEPKLCHKILDHLLMKDERELHQSSGDSGTHDFIQHTSQVVNPVCPQRFVPSFHVLLLGTRPSRAFKILKRPPVDVGQCRTQCCRSPDCLLSFIEDNECYGVTGNPGRINFTMQERTLGLQLAIVDRNKEVSRSLDDEDEDPDELGSDEADNRPLPSKKVTATLKSQSNPGISLQEKNTQLNSKHQSLQKTQLSFTSTNSTRSGVNDEFSKRKFTAKPTKGVKAMSTPHGHVAAKLSTMRPINKDNSHSNLSRQKVITKHDKTASQDSKDKGYRKNTLITKVTEYNPKETSLGHPHAAPKVSKRVKPTKVISTGKVKPRAKTWLVTGQKQESQTTHTEANSKSAHDIIVIKKSKGSKGSRLSKTRRKDDFKSSGSLSLKKESSPILSGLEKKEGSSQEHESHTSGDDDEFSGDGDISGDSGLSGSGQPSGVVPYSSTDDTVLSGDSGKVKGIVKEVSGEVQDWSGADQALSSGENDLSGDDENLSGNSGHLSGDFVGLHKFRDISLQTQKRRGRSKVDGQIRHAVHGADKDSNVRESGGGTEKESGLRNKVSAGRNEEKDQKLKKSDLVEDMDDFGSDEEDSEGTSNTILTLPQKTSFSKTVRHGKKTYNEILNSKSVPNNINLVASLHDLGSDNNAIKATSEKLETLPTRGSKKIQKEILKSTVQKTKVTELVKDPDELGADDDGTKVPSRKVVRLFEKSSTLKAIKQDGKANSDDLNSRERDKTIKVGHVEDPDDLGSDDEDTVKGNSEEHNKFTSRKNGDLPLKAIGAKLLSMPGRNATNTRQELINPKEVEKTRDKIDLVEDLDELGADDNDSFKSADDQRKTKSRKVVGLKSPGKSPISKKANNAAQKSNGRNLRLHTGNQETKKDSNISAKKNTRPNNSDNRLKGISVFQSRPNHKTRPINIEYVKGNASISTKKDKLHARGTSLSFKPRKDSQHFKTAKKGSKSKRRDGHIQTIVRPLLSTTGKHVKTLGIKKTVGTTVNAKVNGSRLVDNGTKTHQTNSSHTANGEGHGGQTITKKKDKGSRKSPSSHAELKHDLNKAENKKTLVKPSVKKSRNTLKDGMVIATQVKSFLKGNPKLEHQGNSSKRKDKTKSNKSSSKVERTDDLMKYAHRKGSATLKPTVNSRLRNFSPTTKRAAFVKTTIPQKQYKVRGLQNMFFHHDATKAVGRLRKLKSLNSEKRPNLQHPASASFEKKGNSTAKNVKTTPSTNFHSILPANLEQESAKKSHSLLYHPHLSTRNNGFNNASLSIKQRSNENSLNAKDDFLSHFHKDSNGSDGVELSVESTKNHHKGKHSKHGDSIDVEDLGDADFDIMMSNDIPHTDFPEKAKGKQKGHKHEKGLKDKERGKKAEDNAKQRQKNKEKEDDREEAVEKSSMHHSSHKHKNHHDHHHHPHKTENDYNNEESHSSKEEDSYHSKNGRTGSHSHGESEAEMGHRQKTHRHKATTFATDDNNDNNSEKSGKRKKKHDLGDSQKTERHRHQRHKTHAKTYDSNIWSGKIIPGKVKVTFDDDSDEKQHRIHKIKDKKEESHHKRKHSVKTQENHKDDIEETEVRKRHGHHHHNHHQHDEGDIYKKKRKHIRQHKDRAGREEREKDKEEDNKEKPENIEKKKHTSYHKGREGDEEREKNREEDNKEKPENIEKKKHTSYHKGREGDKEREKNKEEYNEEKPENIEKRKHTRHHKDGEGDEEREKNKEEDNEEKPENIEKRKHTRHHKDRQENEGKRKDKEENREEKEGDAEKKTDVNYETVKPGRHRFGHHEEEETSYDEERDEKENSHKHDESRDEEDNSSKDKNDDRSDDDDDSRKNDESRRKDESDEDDDRDEKEERHHSHEKTKENRVVLGQDSEGDDDDGNHHSDQIERRHHEQRHGYEPDGDESEDVRHHSQDQKSQYLKERRKHTLHMRHGHLELKPRHQESHLESEESDNDNDNDDDNGHDSDNGDEKRRNFRKSFIHHKKEDDERRPKQHHYRARNREEQQGDDVNADSEYRNEERERDFHADEHYRQPSHHHRHHYKAPVDNYRKEEKLEDRFEPNGDDYQHEMRQDDSEHFSRHHKIKDRTNKKLRHHEEEAFQTHQQIEEHKPNDDDYRNFQREKEAHHEDYASHDDGQERWNVKEYHDRDSQGDSRQWQNKDWYDHDFIGKGSLPDHFDHHPQYNERRKFKPRHRKMGHWKNRHYYRKDGHEYEDSGGLFDASSWNPDDIVDDDDFYGGEGNYDRKKHRKKHWKHKHRKDRQSYEYWGYGDQNPYYYDYRYHKLRSRYGYYRPQPRAPFDWRNRYRSYDRWKSKPSDWYSGTQHWGRKDAWQHHPTWRQFQERKPTGYRWNKYYNGNGDGKDANEPRPTSYNTDASSFFRPTRPRWQQPNATGRSFVGNHWPPGQNSGPGKQFQDWSQNSPSGPAQVGGVYNPQQHPTYGAQPRSPPSVSGPDGRMHPTGVQSKYVPPAPQQTPPEVSNWTRFHPTVRRQYPATPPSIVASPTNITQIKIMMDKLKSPPSALGGQQPIRGPNVQNKPDVNSNLPKINLTSSDQEQDRNRLNGFFKEENAGKKSAIIRLANSTKGLLTTNSSSANTSQHTQQNPPKTTPLPQTAHTTNTTTTPHTSPMEKTSNHSSTPPHAAQNKSTTAGPTQKSTTGTPTAPNFGDESQTDDSSETGKKHRKHRDPVCTAGKTTDDLTLLRGKRAGNFTNVGDVGDFGRCIKRCCQKQDCDLAFKSAETCFLVSCFSQESCETSPAIDDIFKPRMSFVKRRSRDSDTDISGQDGDDEWNDKISPSGIHEVCEAEKALGILWKKTVAGDYSSHPCPRDAKGFVKRRCEADSRWLPPNFSDCVSKDYQALYDKSKMLASGADPSPLIRELSQLTTQNIDNSLIFGGDLDRATDIMTAIVQHNGQTDSSDMTRHDVENFVRASSNLLDMTNQQEWVDIQKNKPGTAGVLRSMEMFALQAIRRLSLEDMAEPTITDNIIIKMDRKSPGDGGLTFPDFSNPRIDRWDARHDIIALPSSVFNQETSVATISFKTLPYLLPDSNVSTGLGPNSKIVSAVMYPQPQGKITPPVTIVLSHIKRRRGNPNCVFWDYTLNPHRGGAWSSRGCWLAFNNQSHSICQCSHLSHFAVLMDLSSDESLQKEQKKERTMALMWIGIPVLIVGVIGGLYMSFSWNRKSGIPSTVTRPSAALNEKTGLLGQRVVTSQVREEFPASPTRDLYRALSPGYSPTGDLEWQDEFDFDVESGDQGFKQMLLPKLQLLQNQLINEFYNTDKMETKKKLLQENKVQRKTKTTIDSPVLIERCPFGDMEMSQTNPQTIIETPDECERRKSVDQDNERIQAKPQMKIDNPDQNGAGQLLQEMQTSSKRQKLRVRFADESLPGRNHTDEDKERFRRLQRMERRVFAQHLSRWNANSHLNLSPE